MTPTLAELREQWTRKPVVEADRVEGEDNNGFTYGFDPAYRRKYIEVMKKTYYSELPRFKDSDTSKGYFCGSCEYMKADNNSVTGYTCQKFLFSDRPWGCCAGYEEKGE